MEALSAIVTIAVIAATMVVAYALGYKHGENEALLEYTRDELCHYQGISQQTRPLGTQERGRGSDDTG